jgi:hypothetical protein
MLDFIKDLRYNYPYNNNLIDINYQLSDNNFFEYLKKFKKEKNITIYDNKVYNYYDHFMYVDNLGNNTYIYKKILKYKYFDDKQVVLLNKKIRNSDYFNLSLIKDEYKEKKIIFNIDNIKIFFIIKMRKNKNNTKKDQDKVINNYIIRIRFNINEDIKVVKKILLEFN